MNQYKVYIGDQEIGLGVGEFTLASEVQNKIDKHMNKILEPTEVSLEFTADDPEALKRFVSSFRPSKKVRKQYKKLKKKVDKYNMVYDAILKNAENKDYIRMFSNSHYIHKLYSSIIRMARSIDCEVNFVKR